MVLTTTLSATNSNSYVTVAELDTYALEYSGVDLSAVAEIDKEQFLRRAVQYMDLTWKWVGVKMESAQRLGWPRSSNVLVDGTPIPTDVIPQAIKDAQCEIALALNASIDLAPVVEGGIVIKETVKAGPVMTSTEFVGAEASPRVTMANNLLKHYSIGGGSDNTTDMVRG